MDFLLLIACFFLTMANLLSRSIHTLSWQNLLSRRITYYLSRQNLLSQEKEKPILSQQNSQSVWRRK